MTAWSFAGLCERPGLRRKAPLARDAALVGLRQIRRCVCRSASTSAKKEQRTYDEALRRLWQLQPNRRATGQFGQASGSGTQPTREQLNESSQPEMRYWLRRAGYKPEDLARMRFVHVAGTKGKGSVCAYATAILRRYGRVGTYTSPHLVSPRERIAIDGEPVKRHVFARAFFRLWDRFTAAACRDGVPAEEADGPETKPFFFRFLTIMAWDIFLKRDIRTVVMECGIGGEYDSTNVVPVGSVSSAVITQLGIDHVAMLGDTVEQIAWHKAGILKPGARGFTRALTDQPAVMDVLRRRATEKGAGLVEVPDSLVESWGGVDGGLRGDFQKHNQALALLAAMHHLGMDSNPASALRSVPAPMLLGLREARLRGRCEELHDGNMTWLLDGAHTKESLEQAAKWCAQRAHNDELLVLVFNQQERDAARLLTDFVGDVRRATGRDDIFSHALFTRNDTKRAGRNETRDLAVQRRTAAAMVEVQPLCRTAVFDNVVDAVQEARRLVAGDAARPKVMVTGSLHLVGGVLGVLDPDSLL